MTRFWKVWTQKEENALRFLWESQTCLESICNTLNRSKHSISHKVRDMRLARPSFERKNKSNEVIAVPEWAPEIYREIYLLIASSQDEYEAAAWVRFNMTCDKIAGKNGCLL